MKNFLHLAFVLLMLFVFSVNAQTSKISVEVSVTAENSIKSDIESYIKRELRALNDIDLYATKPEYEIQLIAITPGNAVAISVIVIDKLDLTKYLNNTLSSKGIDAKTTKDLVNTFAVKESVTQHFLYSDSVDNLSELCKKIVASIDADTFERERKINRAIEDVLNKSNPPSTQSRDDLPDLSRFEVKKTNPPTNTQPKQDNQPVFERRYVGGNKPPQIVVKNDASETLTLNFGSSKFTIPGGQTQTINTTEGGVFSFVASAPGIESLSGQKNFERGYIYSWRFFVVTVRR